MKDPLSGLLVAMSLVSATFIHHGVNLLRLPVPDAHTIPDTISIVDGDLHSYLPYGIFLQNLKPLLPEDASRLFCAAAQIDNSTTEHPGPK